MHWDVLSQANFGAKSKCTKRHQGQHMVKNTMKLITIWGHQGKTSKGHGNSLDGLCAMWAPGRLRVGSSDMISTSIYLNPGSAWITSICAAAALAIADVALKPSLASLMVGSNKVFHCSVPYNWWAFHRPATSPGTATADPPGWWDWKRSMRKNVYDYLEAMRLPTCFFKLKSQFIN